MTICMIFFATIMAAFVIVMFVYLTYERGFKKNIIKNKKQENEITIQDSAGITDDITVRGIKYPKVGKNKK